MIETFGFPELAQLVAVDVEQLQLWHLRSLIPAGELINGVRCWRWADAEIVEAACTAAKVAAVMPVPMVEPRPRRETPMKQTEKKPPQTEKKPDIGRPVSVRMDIPPDKLHVDERHYQRSQVNQKNIQRIYNGFSWYKFETLWVGKRPDGTFWIVDGHQRYIVCKMLGVKSIPCEVFESSGYQMEADTFHGVNSGRTQLSPFQKYRAAVTAKKEPAYSIARMLTRLGLKAVNSRSGSQPLVVGFLDRIMQNFAEDPKATEEVLRMQLAMTGDAGPMALNPHKGLFYLLRPRNIPEVAGRPSPINDEDIAKLRMCGGRPSIEAEISLIQALARKADRPHSPLCAQAILNLINKNKRNKKVLPATAEGLPTTLPSKPTSSDLPEPRRTVQ